MEFFNLKKNLEKLGYNVSEFNTKEEATKYLETTIINKSIGIGGSETVKDMNLLEALSKRNNIITHINLKEKQQQDAARRKAITTDIYITSVNAIAETGEIINIDNTGNRVASILYGHDKVYFLVGENKITKTYDEAYFRARNIAGPLNSKRLNKNTPCAIKGDKCYNCKSSDRICRALTVLWYPPLGCEYEIILIHENLGY